MTDRHTRWGAWLLGAAVGALAAAGCRPSKAVPGESPRLVELAAVERFDSVFELIDSVTLEQGPGAPIVRVSGLDRRADGVLALGDASESNVKLFDASGRLLRIIGRNGEGPGEFLQPRYPVFHSDGRLFVADAQLGRVTVFSAEGDLQRTIPLEAGFPLMGFELLQDGRLVVTAPGPDRQMVLLVDTTGRTVGGLLQGQSTRPRTEPDYDGWKYLAQVWIAGHGSDLAITYTLSDSLWLINPIRGTSQSLRLAVRGYKEPRMPQSQLRTVQEISAWQEAFHTTADVLLSDRLLLVPFVQGVLNYGDPMILAARLPDGTWRALDQAPPPVLVSGDTVFTLLHTQESPRMVLGLHRPRS